MLDERFRVNRRALIYSACDLKRGATARAYLLSLISTQSLYQIQIHQAQKECVHEAIILAVRSRRADVHAQTGKHRLRLGIGALSTRHARPKCSVEALKTLEGEGIPGRV